jgi:hypothetical protein
VRLLQPCFSICRSAARVYYGLIRLRRDMVKLQAVSHVVGDDDHVAIPKGSTMWQERKSSRRGVELGPRPGGVM